MSRTARLSQCGFSLLELMVAISVMALSLAMLYRVDAGAVRGVAAYAQQQRAGVLARSILESRDAVPADGWHETGQDAGFEWRVSTTPQFVPPGLNLNATVLHEVLVTVQWSGLQGQRSMEFRTLLPQSRVPSASARQ